MSYQDLNDIGIILPSKVRNFDKESSHLIDKFVVFQPKQVTYKGTVKWYGEINDNKAYGIETDGINLGTGGSFNGHRIFQCKDECGVLIQDTDKLLEIDEEVGSIHEKHYNKFNRSYQAEYKDSDFVVVRFTNKLKIVHIIEYGDINGMLCYKLKPIEDSKSYIFIKTDILGKFANEDGLVNSFIEGSFNPIKSSEVFKADIGRKICFERHGKYEKGILKWKGKIDGLRCIGVVPDSGELASNFRKYFPNEIDPFWAVICLNMLGTDKLLLYEISDPSVIGIQVYFRINAYVNILSKTCDGSVETYFTDGTEFYYEIKYDKGEFFIAKSDDVKCGFTGIAHKPFEGITDPNGYGIKTKFRLGDSVRIHPDRENKLDSICFGVIDWMGFDGVATFKFFLRLDKPNKLGNNGTSYGFRLGQVADGCGLLVETKCVELIEHKEPENQKYISSEIVEDYQAPRFKITCEIEKGIQGDKNSCYMDTSFFAMFTFQEIFDNLFLSNDNDDNTEIRDILKSRIVFPLRKNEYVSFDRVSEFRSLLGKLFPEKKFINNEKDPEELLETLFHLLTPNDPMLRTYDIASGIKQNCFMTQLFYENDAKHSKITKLSEMLSQTFLQGRFLINKPPKCLILQLPRHGTLYKQYKEVLIEPKIDISHLIRHGEKKCTLCSNVPTQICLNCEKYKFVYYCSNHINNCTHEKSNINDSKKKFKGKIELELFAILCIEKTHYVAYVKTGEVLGKWVYYDSMAKSDQKVLKPEIRETNIGKYFNSNVEDDLDSEHVTRIKNFAFVCFYKNPTLEYYSRDFNHIGKPT